MGIRKTVRVGLLITFEGIEGSGKSTQLRKLATFLRQRGYRVVETREPGGTPLAERIREILLGRSEELASPERLTAACEAGLILAARSQHVTHVIKPALEAGSIVLCDRFSDSTLAYQGYGRGLPLPTLQQLNTLATNGLVPDLTLLFDIPVSMGLLRRRTLKARQNRLDREAPEFYEKVRCGYLALASHEPERIKTIDARPPMDSVAVKVRSLVRTLLATHAAQGLKTVVPRKQFRAQRR